MKPIAAQRGITVRQPTLPRVAFALALIIAPLAAAADQLPTGKSAHGEAFDAGPRQAPVHMSGTGIVVFPVTTISTEAQAFITQGVGLIHGFWYFEAERAFREAAMLDPDCAMAFWGMAFANFDNDNRAKAFITQAVKRKDKASPREQQYVDALNNYFSGARRDNAGRRRELAGKYESIAQKFPTDLEAKAFLIWQLWDNSQHGVPLESKLAINALIGEILAVEPRHPVHHYRVHITNPNDDPTRAFASAALCGPVAPAIPHMWHMPGHTYVDAKRYADAAWQMEAAYRLENAHMMRMHMVPDENHLYVHNRGWLIDNLEYAGHVRDAIDLCRHIVDLPRHPQYGKASAAEARRKLYDILIHHERWDELLALENTDYLEPTSDRVQQARRQVIFGRAELGRGDRSAAFARLAKLNDLCDDARKDVAKAWAESFGANHLPGVVASAWAAGLTPSPADFAVDLLAADRLLRQPGTKINAANIRAKLATLRTFEQPAAELRGHIALANGGAKAALDLFAKAGNVDQDVLARAHAIDGAHALVDTMTKDTGRRVYKLANRVDLLQRAGKTADARAAFVELRSLAGTADPDDPPIARLVRLAGSYGWPADWRTPIVPSDIGERPPLASFGPLRWSGWQAPDWALPDADGRIVHSADSRGKPVIVIFYLGIGCVHCVEQLAAFTPKAREFAAAGIEVIAIGTDSSKTLKGADADGKYPFTVLSDQAMTGFRAYGAFDDFEKLPLHGTILIDASGRVRWQDIGAKPFNDPDFLLAEAQRLLKPAR
jgi:peroxiredoxin